MSGVTEDLPFELSEENLAKLLSYPTAHTVGLGLKEVNGELTGEFAVRVMVTRKIPRGLLAERDVIPTEIQGVQTDVIESSEFYELADCTEINDAGTYRPLRGGIQINSLDVCLPGSTGTLGCLAITRDTNEVVLLSNHHILASGGAEEGDDVGQPEMCCICSACCSDEVAKIVRTVFSARVDGGIAKVNPGVPTMATVEDIGTIAGTNPLTAATAVGVPVQKRGKTTGHTFGIVVAFIPSGTVRNHGGFVRNYVDQLDIRVIPPSTCFVLGGDSGSVALDDQRRVVGLLFAGNTEGTRGLASPIQDVERELNIDIATPTSLASVTASAVLTDSDDVLSPTDAIAAAATESPPDGTSPGGLTRMAGPNGLDWRLERAANRLSAAGHDASTLLDSPVGQLGSELLRRHEGEARYLANHNKRVAAVWRRNRGPEIIHHLVRSSQDPSRTVPVEIAGRPFSDCVHRILDQFSKYGSAELIADIEAHREFLAGLGGLAANEMYDGLLHYTAAPVAPNA